MRTDSHGSGRDEEARGSHGSGRDAGARGFARIPDEARVHAGLTDWDEARMRADSHGSGRDAGARGSDGSGRDAGARGFARIPDEARVHADSHGSGRDAGARGFRAPDDTMLTETAAGLYCEAGGFHIDPWQPVARALITHAHGDHAREGSAAYLCAADCAPLLRRRFGAEAVIEGQPYGESLTLGRTRVSFHPAGHVLGSAQIRIEGPDGTWVVSGDYKRAADPTCAPFEPLRCDAFVTESTFGLPIYRWDPAVSVVADIVAWWDGNAVAGKASVLFCYTIGKAQRVLAELARITDRRVLVHGMMLGMIETYREAGIAMLPVASATERPKGVSFAGELVLAPLSARGTPWMRRLGVVSDAFASGLMRVRGVRRQRAFDRGFVLSDHADWPGLLQTITESGASRVLATHGHAEPLARHLRERGLDAGVIRTAWEGEGLGD